MKKVLLLLVAAAFIVASSASAQAEVIGFKTPSGNIGCIYANFPPSKTSKLRCDIRSGLHNPKLPPRGNCSTEVDFGQGLWIETTGPAHIVCAGDTALDPQAKVVPYGTSFIHAGFRCDSKSIGLTCRNESGHGFFLNADVWRLF